MLRNLGEWLQAGRSEREASVELCLKRIREIDGKIRAWVRVEPQEPTGDGELFAIPFGVKDVIETANLPTEYGSPVYEGHQGSEDAALVRDLRRRGALLMGKTQTAAFAYRNPPPTRNPRHLKHTPGGSSSGSAAVVAADMVPFALGTQTCGSVLRPACYCGVTGFKPSYGVLPTEGILPLAPSLDTVGLFTHTAADMLLLWKCLGYRVAGAVASRCLGIADSRLAVNREIRKAIERATEQLCSAGFDVRRSNILPLLEEVNSMAEIVLDYEGARTHCERWRVHREQLGSIGNLVRKGANISCDEYAQARVRIQQARERVATIFATTPVFITPAATRTAPWGLRSTGDATMNTPWTALGVPAISIPIRARGLPIGMQLTASWGQDAMLLHTATQVETILHRKT